MLTFPTETTDTGLATGFEHGNHDGGTAHRLRLFTPNGKQACCWLMASTKPLPRVFVDIRRVRMLSSGVICSTISG